MSANTAAEFQQYLAGKYRITSELGSKLGVTAAAHGEKTFRKLWESTDLSANDFADEVARFYGRSRITLPQLFAASALVGQVARRCLRETTVFPYRSADGAFKLAVGDPSDLAAIRAAEIVLGGPVEVEIASFEDIATVLSERLGEEAASPAAAKDAAVVHGDDDIESLRDLASGAPVVRAVNDLLEKAVELRASDIHVEPFRNGLTVRMRVDGILRPVAAPAGVLPPALISRANIIS